MSSNTERRSGRRKQQTRLTFEPVVTSSPAALSPARVRYTPSGKRPMPVSSLQRDINDEEDSDDEVLGPADKKRSLKVDTTAGSSGIRNRNISKQLFKTLPRPARSSRTSGNDSAGTLHDDSDESDIRPPQSARRRSLFLSAEKKDRSTAGFEGAADSSAGSTSEDTQGTPTKLNKNTQPNRGRAKKPTRPEIITLDSDSEPETYRAQPTRSRGHISNGESSKRATRSTPAKKTAAPKITRSKSILLSGSDDELQLPKLKNSKGKAAAKTRSTPKPQKSKKPAFIEIESEIEDENESDDDLFVSSPKRSQRPLYEPRKADSDPESDGVRSSPLKRRRPQTAPQDDEDEAGDEPITLPLKRPRKAAQIDNPDVPGPMKRRRPGAQSDSDSDISSIIKPSYDAKGKGKERARSYIGPPDTPMRTRQARGRKHRTAKQIQMELLKRRRAGENIEELTESESDEENDDEDEFQKLYEFEDDEESPGQPKKSAKGKGLVKRQRGDSSEEAGESDFVVDEDDGPLGVPDYSQLMPLQFTQAAHKPMKEHFRDAVEWMVQKKLNPAFTWNHPVYNRAFEKLDNEYHGFADSKFVSSQWTAEFTRAVYARPIILISELAPGEGINALGESKCEPCNHRNHHPSYALQFTGKAYHKATLEEIDSESDDSDEEDEDGSDDDKASLNSQGQSLPSTDRIWMSGSVCKQNAEQAHTLIHWRWHLNDWVVGNLEAQGYFEPAKLAAREKLSTNKRMKIANSVMDKWESDRIIKTLYHDFKTQLETARDLKAQTRGGWK